MPLDHVGADTERAGSWADGEIHGRAKGQGYSDHA